MAVSRVSPSEPSRNPGQGRRLLRNVASITIGKILADIGQGHAPELLVFNQADRLPPGEARAIAQRPGGVAVSAVTGDGLTELLAQAEELLFSVAPAHGFKNKAEDLAAVGS